MEVKEFLQEAEDSMQLAVEYLDETLGRIDLQCGQHFGARRPHHRHHSLGEVHV